MYEMLKRRARPMFSDLAEFASDLIRISSPSGSERAAAECVTAEMARRGYNDAFVDEWGNAVGVVLGSKYGPTLLLLTHLDTVLDTTAAPPRHDGTRLRGAGAADCKAGTAAQVFAGHLLASCPLHREGNLVVAATVGERNGLSLGLRRFMAHTLPGLGFSPTHAVLGEPTGTGLYYGHEGWVDVSVRVGGATPAVAAAAQEAVGCHLQAVAERRTGAAGREMLLFSDCRQEAGAGDAVATRTVCRRLMPGQTDQEAVGDIADTVDLVTRACGASSVSVEVKEDLHDFGAGHTCRVACTVHPWRTDPFSPLMDGAREALRSLGKPVQTGMWTLDRLHMGTAGGTLAIDYGVPAIGYGPGDESLAHRPDEYVEIDKLETAFVGTTAIAQRLIGVPTAGWATDEP